MLTSSSIRLPFPADVLFIPRRNKTGGTGVSPVQAQPEACGYKKLLVE
jgi:hypothetical protein